MSSSELSVVLSRRDVRPGLHFFEFPKDDDQKSESRNWVVSSILRGTISSLVSFVVEKTIFASSFNPFLAIGGVVVTGALCWFGRRNFYSIKNEFKNLSRISKIISILFPSILGVGAQLVCNGNVLSNIKLSYLLVAFVSSISFFKEKDRNIDQFFLNGSNLYQKFTVDCAFLSASDFAAHEELKRSNQRIVSLKNRLRR